MTITKQQLENLQNKLEKNNVKEEYSQSILEVMHDTFDDIAGLANSANSVEDKNIVTYEVNRIATRTEVLFNLLFELYMDSNQITDEVVTELSRLKQGADNIE